ncbi:hypothetical protein LINGRAHAP2_LOCUS34011 [Linum grandiflorum]
MAATMLQLLILTILAATVAGEYSYCSSRGPVEPVGECAQDYTNCVTNVITQLRDMTPYVEHQTYTTYYPVDQPSGGVFGQAGCFDDGTSFTNCRNCLIFAQEWLSQTCAPSSGAGYYEQSKVCSMTYGQIVE